MDVPWFVLQGCADLGPSMVYLLMLPWGSVISSARTILINHPLMAGVNRQPLMVRLVVVSSSRITTLQAAAGFCEIHGASRGSLVACQGSKNGWQRPVAQGACIKNTYRCIYIIISKLNIDIFTCTCTCIYLSIHL